MKYNKLVRDKIPEYIRKKGGVPIIHIANDKEYWKKLKEKLVEKTGEFEKDEIIEEFADVLEIINAIRVYKKFSKVKLASIRVSKAREKGKFRKKIILEES